MNKKEQQAIDFLRSMERDDPMCLGFSGGKDSVVILDLAERSGIKYNASYANTTVDPPGTISFIKKNYSQVQILHPKKSFFQLVENKGLPGRMRRFCCEKLKEQYGIGQRTIEGMRAEESQSRASYEPEQCDARSITISPIIFPVMAVLVVPLPVASRCRQNLRCFLVMPEE